MVASPHALQQHVSVTGVVGAVAEGAAAVGAAAVGGSVVGAALVGAAAVGAAEVGAAAAGQSLGEVQDVLNASVLHKPPGPA